MRPGRQVILVFAAAVAALGVPPPSYFAALRFLGQDRPAEAIPLLRQILESDPSEVRAYDTVVRASRDANRAGDAETLFAGLQTRHPASPYPHYGLALYYKSRRDFERAAKHIEHSLGGNPGFLAAYKELADVSVQGKRPAELETRLKNRLASEPGDAALLYALGYLSVLRGEWTKALEYLDKAAAARPGEWEITEARYFACFYMSRGLEAISTLAPMLEKFQREHDEEREAITAGRIGMIHSNLGNYHEALVHLDRAVELTARFGDRQQEQIFRANRGLVHMFVADHTRALEDCRRSLEIASKLRLRGSEGRNWGLLANIHAEKAEYAEALVAYQTAIELARKTADRRSEADQLASLSLIHSALGDHEKGLDTARQALAIAREVKNSWLEGRFLEILGSLERKLGRSAAAFQSYENALRIANELGDQLGQTTRLASLGEVRALQGNYPGALADFERALRLAQTMGARLVEGGIHNSRGRVSLRLNDAEGAIGHHRSALEIGRETGLPEVVWQAHAGMAAAFERQKRLSEAESENRRAIEEIESIRGSLALMEDKAGFLGERQEVYERQVRLLTALHKQNPRQGHGNEVFHFMERSRARALLDLLAERRNGIAEPGLDPRRIERKRDLEARLSQLQARLAGHYRNPAANRNAIRLLNSELSRAEEEYLSLRREIRLRTPQQAAFEYPEPAGATEARRLLDPETALVSYFVGRESSYAFALTPEQHMTARLPPAGAIAERVETLRHAIAQGPKRSVLSSYITEARALYRMLIQPLEPVLRSKPNWIIVPDGALHYLPFAALLKQVDTGADVARLPYLARETAISYAPSASVLKALRSMEPRKEPAILVYADPSYRDAARRLPYSQREAENIANLFGKAAAVRTGAAANESDLKSAPLRGYRWIHFAVHGAVDEQQPQRSALALSDAGPAEDGLLQVREIFNLDLNADLVILSACETGLGKWVRGEGLLGFTQAFLYAGTPSLLVSLWRVNDQSTARFMDLFYGRLRQGKAEALRSAQKGMIGNSIYAHPYFWAPFVLIGP